MKKIICLLLCIGLLACSSAKKAIYQAPDESLVIQNRPLTLPPEYELRPPVTDTTSATKQE
ncbi:MAG: DUF3035 domain-containing protein [Alphaproteobacteria bacterium]|nr:DUF3035 domain-containing protein [Alphaproteobacteria bacterium]